jgi:hypothetical protein
MISGIAVAPIKDRREPSVGVCPGDGFTGSQIKDVSASAEAIEAWLRACVGVLEAPPARELELSGTAQHELNDSLRVSGRIITNP